MTDLLEKAKALEKAHNQKPAKRESNRAKYPEIAEAVDRFREVFGDGVRVIKVVDKSGHKE